MVAVKIDEVDKRNPLHPKMLLGKIISVEDTGCVHSHWIWENKHTYFYFTFDSLYSH